MDHRCCGTTTTTTNGGGGDGGDGGCPTFYASPQAAVELSPRESTLLVAAPHCRRGTASILAAVDVDPASDTYQQVVSRVDFPFADDEVHHTGWNACSSCYGDSTRRRTHLVLPCLAASRIYVVDVSRPRELRLHKVVEAAGIKALNVSFPHTVHCLGSGEVMIGCVGDAEGNARGDFILLDGATFEPKGRWAGDAQKPLPFGYDFWYQPRIDRMISTEWGAPNAIGNGFSPSDYVENDLYGHSINIWSWRERRLIQTIELPKSTGALPLEVRFLHAPSAKHAYVGAALGSAIFHVAPDDPLDDASKWSADCVAQIPAALVDGWMLPEMPALVTDILVSMDDRFLYCSCWLHGELRAYDLSDPAAPKLAQILHIGGLLVDDGVSKIRRTDGIELRPPTTVRGRVIVGGPQMLQLTPDGRRLYVTTSLYRRWDEQFYPDLVTTGGVLLKVDVSSTGEMTLDESFLVDFGTLPGGPFLAHETRIPTGDCTSDIWP